MTTDLMKIAFALGFEPKEDFTFEDIQERATFFRRFVEASYRSGTSDAKDFEAAARGVAPATVGRLLAALNRDAARHATTEPGSPGFETDEEPMRLPPMKNPDHLPKIEEA